jgi:acid phosphatase type 7
MLVKMPKQWLLLAALTALSYGRFISHLADIDVASTVTPTEFDDTISLQFHPSLLDVSGACTTLALSNVPYPSDADWVALYAPLPDLLNSSAPVKFQYANFSADYITTGAAEFKFCLPNVGAPYAAVFLRGGIGAPLAVAKSAPATFRHADEPLMVHTAVGGQTPPLALVTPPP